MIEAIIAGTVLALVGALVTFGLHRVENHLKRQDTEATARAEREQAFQLRVTGALEQNQRDIGALARKLKMRRQQDGQLY